MTQKKVFELSTAEKKEVDDRRKRYEARKEGLKAGGITRIFEKSWKDKIDRAKQENEREVALYIGQGPGYRYCPEPEEKALVDVGIQFLRNRGLSAEFKRTYTRFLGSDDQYGDRTWLNLIVTW